jgi:hypothetical protein
MDIKKYLTNEENQQIIIGFLSILIFLWLILYVIPGIFTTLFHTLLGNLIILLGIILLGSKDIKYSLLALLLVIVLYRFSQISQPLISPLSNNETNLKEGFTWSQQSTTDFIKLQDTLNPHVVFDTNKIQNQASQEEVDYFLENQLWPWSQEVQELYKESVMNNQYVQINPVDAVTQARQIYNQQIILEIISWQKKEGQFLLNGVIVNDASGSDPSGNVPYSRNGAGSYAFNSGLISTENNPNIKIIKCKSDVSGNYALSQGQYDTTQSKQVYTEVEASDLENIIPGFKFVSQPCNPCVALNSPPNYTCPFTLDLSNNNSQGQPNNLFSNNISKVWQYLWGINTDPLQSVPSSTSEANTNTNPNTNPNDFPILGQLQVELNELFTTQTPEETQTTTTQTPEEPTTTTSMSASTV